MCVCCCFCSLADDAQALTDAVAAMGAHNTKLLQEVVRDSRTLLQGTSKDTLKQLVNRRKEMESELQQVVKHKEELLARRAAAVQCIVKDYEARRQRVLEQLQNSASQSPSATTAAGAAVRRAGSDGASSPALPSPESLAGRVEELRREEAEGAKGQGEEGGGRRA